MNTPWAPRLRSAILSCALLIGAAGFTACASTAPPAADQSAPGPKDELDEDDDFDGIPNYDDRCPTVPEDKDGVEDDDGCPEPLPKAN